MPRYPVLYQINTRVWLTERARSLDRPATLDDGPDAELDRLAGMGLDWIWLLSVWQTGAAAQRISRSNQQWRHEFEETLPDLREEDIAGSGLAITGYTVHRDLGGDEALARLRTRLQQRGLRACPAASCAAPTDISRRALVPDGMRPRLAGQHDIGQFRRLPLDWQPTRVEGIDHAHVLPNVPRAHGGLPRRSRRTSSRAK